MENFKLRVRVGSHEFEAEGPQEAVAAQFSVWKSLIEHAPSPPVLSPDYPLRRTGDDTADTDVNAPKGEIATFNNDHLRKIFQVDSNIGVATLRVRASGDKPVADSVLLILYGQNALMHQDEVPTTRLMSALEMSGYTNLGRIDRPVHPYVRDGLLIQSGRLKGTKYRLTTQGLLRAEELIRVHLQQLV